MRQVLGKETFPGSNSDEVVLVDTILDLPTPQGRSTDLVDAAIPFDHEQVALSEPEVGPISPSKSSIS